MSSRGRACWTWVTCAAIAGCTDPTQVLLRIDADSEVAARAEALRIQIFTPEGQPTYDERATFGETLERLDVAPAQVTIVPAGRDATRSYRAVMSLEDGGEVFSVRRIVAGFEEGRVRELRVHFDAACSDSAACAEDQTCDAPDGVAACVGACAELSPVGTHDRAPLRSCADAPGPACRGVAGGSPCSVEGQDGRCWDEACCTGCWDGTACVEGAADDACGRRGAECTDCAASCAGSTCTVTGGCSGFVAPAVFVGRSTTCARGAGGLVCWGVNDRGQVGDGSTDPAPSPVQVASGTREAVAPGFAHTCSLSGRGRISCWGSAADDQLGFWDTDQLEPPAPNDTPEANFDAIAAGERHTCGVRDGRVYCWGNNVHGQIGQSERFVTYAPTEIVAAAGAEVLSANHDVTCVVIDEQLVCWGLNIDLQLGIPEEPGVISYHEAQVDSSVSWEDVDVGRFGVCGLADGGQLFCRGTLATRELQREPPAPHLPALIDPGPFRALTAGSLHVCAIDMNDRLLCAGANLRGELGAGPSAPARSRELLPVGGVGWTWRHVDAGARTTCAVRDDLTLWCWGDDETLQLGSAGGETASPRRVCAP